MVWFLQHFASWKSFCFASLVVLRSILQSGATDVFAFVVLLSRRPHESDLLFHCKTVCILAKF
jgi:hypothetical protein